MYYSFLVYTHNSLFPGRFVYNFTHEKITPVLIIGILIISFNHTRLHEWYVNVGSGNGLVSSRDKTLPVPILTKLYDATLCHQGPIIYLWKGWNIKELNIMWFDTMYWNTSVRYICSFTLRDQKHGFPWWMTNKLWICLCFASVLLYSQF